MNMNINSRSDTEPIQDTVHVIVGALNCNVNENGDEDDSHYAPNKSKSRSQRQAKGSKKEKKYKCNVCGKLFSEKEYLRRHSYQHRAIKPYNCRYCSYGAALKFS